MLSEVARFIGWFVRKHRKGFASYTVYISIYAVVLATALPERFGMIGELNYVIGAVAITLSMFLVVYTSLIIAHSLLSNLWKSYRAEYPRRKRKFDERQRALLKERHVISDFLARPDVDTIMETFEGFTVVMDYKLRLMEIEEEFGEQLEQVESEFHERQENHKATY